MRQRGDLPSHLHWQYRELASERAREGGGEWRERERERERESLTTIPHCRQLVLEEKGFVDGLIDDGECALLQELS